MLARWLRRWPSIGWPQSDTAPLPEQTLRRIISRGARGPSPCNRCPSRLRTIAPPPRRLKWPIGKRSRIVHRPISEQGQRRLRSRSAPKPAEACTIATSNPGRLSARLSIAADRQGRHVRPRQWPGDLAFPLARPICRISPGGRGWIEPDRPAEERDLLMVIPGRDRRRAVIMADHYDTAYMEDVYYKSRGGNGPVWPPPGPTTTIRPPPP